MTDARHPLWTRLWEGGWARADGAAAVAITVLLPPLHSKYHHTMQATRLAYSQSRPSRIASRSSLIRIQMKRRASTTRGQPPVIVNSTFRLGLCNRR